MGIKMNKNKNFYDYLIDTDKENSPKSALKDQNGKSFFISKIRELNMMLTMNGFGEIGDLYNNSQISVGKTLRTIQSILEDRQKLSEAKINLFQKVTKHENDKKEYLEKIDELNKTVSD